MEIETRSELIRVSDADASACVLDPATGIALLSEAIEECIRRNAARPKSAALLAVSIDNMQSITDLFGASVVEPVFTGLAARIRDCLRSSDVTARLSETQLGVVLPYFRFNGATVTIKRILALRAKPVLAMHFGAIDLKLSIGSVFSPDPDLSCSDIITRAEAAVTYQQARNQQVLELTRSVRAQVNAFRTASEVA
jgi:diguanylate cyclase (GGDEF)-like protein